MLTGHQRRIFVAIVLNDVPLDALVAELGSNRNAIYKHSSMPGVSYGPISLLTVIWITTR